MPTETVIVRTSRPPDDAFAYMADLRNFAEWDPGVREVDQVSGDGAGPDAAYDVVVDGPRGEMTLRYDTTEWDPPYRLVVVAESTSLRSVDEVTIRPDGDGSVVTYQAQLELTGWFRIANPALSLAFGRIADRAGEGLTEALDGERLDESAGAGERLREAALEGAVVPSFSRIGFALRTRGDDWTDAAADGDLDGSVVVVTGATSGIGRAAATAIARAGATLVVVGRTDERNRATVDDLAATTGSDRISSFAADMGDLDAVRSLAAYLHDAHDRLDVLVHNAGTLSGERRHAPDGTEATVASQVVGPFLLTASCLDLLTAGAPSRVLTMSSGGMYAAGLTVTELEMAPDNYNGTEQYARAKRAQVTINEMWAERFGGRGIHFHALHPGWVDTPGVSSALPGFGKVMGPVLRTPDQGADTLVWLTTAERAITTNGLFWHDRRPRSIHRLPTTSRTDTVDRRARLWDWVADRAGVDPA